jgi:hypothetical protein
MRKGLEVVEVVVVAVLVQVDKSLQVVEEVIRYQTYQEVEKALHLWMDENMNYLLVILPGGGGLNPGGGGMNCPGGGGKGGKPGLGIIWGGGGLKPGGPTT